MAGGNIHSQGNLLLNTGLKWYMSAHLFPQNCSWSDFCFPKKIFIWLPCGHPCQALTTLVSIQRFSSVQLLSCPTLCDPMDCSTPGLPVHQQLPEFTETHVHLVGGAIQPSHPLSTPSSPAFNLSQYQGFFQ